MFIGMVCRRGNLCVEKLYDGTEDLHAHLPGGGHRLGRLAQFDHRACKAGAKMATDYRSRKAKERPEFGMHEETDPAELCTIYYAIRIVFVDAMMDA